MKNYNSKRLVPLLYKLRYFEQDAKITEVTKQKKEHQTVGSFFKGMVAEESSNPSHSDKSDIDSLLKEKLYIHKSIFSMDIDDLITKFGENEERMIVNLANDTTFNNIIREDQIIQMKEQIQRLSNIFDETGTIGEKWKQNDSQTLKVGELSKIDYQKKEVFHKYQREFLKQVMNETEEGYQKYIDQIKGGYEDGK